MGRPRNESRRVLGPYSDGAEWRLVVVDPSNEGQPRSSLTYSSQPAAERAKAQIEAEWHRLAEVTIKTAIDDYDTHLRRKGNKDASRIETIRRLRLFFADVELAPVGSIDRKRGAALYETFAVGRSADYHRNTLAEARTFYRWCVERGWCKANPLEPVKGVGKRSRGKRQLTRDEAIKFDAAARQMTERGDMGALGAWMLLLLGVRQSEVRKRRVRDVDADCTLLRIEDAKTAAGDRLVEIPGPLRPHLAALVMGRKPLDLLFGEHTKSWLRFAVRRVCDAAKVPQVTPHGLRGTHASLGTAAGATAHLVAAQLGHESASTTLAHYTDPRAVQAAAQDRALRVIHGGRK